MDLFERYVVKLLDFVLLGSVDELIGERPTQTIPISNLGMVIQFLT